MSYDTDDDLEEFNEEVLDENLNDLESETKVEESNIPQKKNKSQNFENGMKYLASGMYDLAINYFEKAIADDNTDYEIYRNIAISSLKGKRPFHLKRSDIDIADKNIAMAIAIGQEAIDYYIQAYLKYDYFYRKSFATSPNYVECYNNAIKRGLNKADIEKIHKILKTEIASFQ